MYIIFNKDGSVKEKQLDEYVNQHSDGVNFIDIVIDGYDYDKYTASGTFLLPNKETLTATAEASNGIATSSGTYNGWRFYLFSAETQYEGSLSFTAIATQGSAQLFTYLVEITVNATARQLSTSITWDEYTQLLRTITDYQLQYSPTNVRAYMGSPYAANKDLANLAIGQVVLAYGSGTKEPYIVVADSKSESGKSLQLIKNLGKLSLQDAYVYKSLDGSTWGSAIQTAQTGLLTQFAHVFADEVKPSESYYPEAMVQYGTVYDETAKRGKFVAYAKYGAKGFDTAKYSGSIDLGASTIAMETTDPVTTDGETTHVYVFQADQNATTLANPTTGTSTLTLETGTATLSANAVSLKYGGDTEVYLGTGYGGAEGVTLKSPRIMLAGGDGKLITYASGVTRVVYFYQIPCLDKALTPNNDLQLTPKKYVDEQDTSVKNYATDLVQKDHEDLQDQIDAINASQNFVATYASKADMPTPPVSGLEEKDCVLVLKDESKQDQAYVYKYASTGWVEVGPLGDYYTKAQIDDMFTNDQHIYVSEDGFVCVDYDKLPVRA